MKFWPAAICPLISSKINSPCNTSTSLFGDPINQLHIYIPHFSVSMQWADTCQCRWIRKSSTFQYALYWHITFLVCHQIFTCDAADSGLDHWRATTTVESCDHVHDVRAFYSPWFPSNSDASHWQSSHTDVRAWWRCCTYVTVFIVV